LLLYERAAYRISKSQVARMGHDSVRAAMIYQHAAAEADQKIANTLDQRMGRLMPMSALPARLDAPACAQ